MCSILVGQRQLCRMPMTDDERAVIQVNAAFYEACCRCDMGRMEKLWSSEHEVAVIYPGWLALYGRDKVLTS